MCPIRSVNSVAIAVVAMQLQLRGVISVLCCTNAQDGKQKKHKSSTDGDLRYS